jgi:hypothetical protein
MDQDKKQNTQNPQDPNRQGQQQDPNRQGQQNQPGHDKDQDQRRQPGSNPEHEGQKDRKTA